MRDADELLGLAERGLEAAARGGADDAEVYLWSAQGTKASRAGRFRDTEGVDYAGVSVRAFVDGRLAYATTSGLSDDAVSLAVERALAAARLLPRHPAFAGFAEPQPVPQEPTRVDPATAEPDPDRLMGMADTLAAVAEAAKDVDYYDVGAIAHFGRFAVANANGVATWDHDAFEALRIEVRCRGEGPRFGEGAPAPRFAIGGLGDRHPLDEAHDLAVLAERTVRMARDALQAGTLDRSTHDVIFDAQTAHDLLAKLLPSFGGKPAATGRSVFSDKLGEAVASDRLSLLDQPRGPGGYRNQRVDDEGTPTANRALIEDGVLRSYVYDWAGAQEVGAEPTGHGLRPTIKRYESQVGVRIPNLVVQPGDWSLDEMVEGVDRGVLVQGSLMGSFVMNAATGDFSLTAPLASYIQGGAVRNALTSTMVAGNLFEAVQNVHAVGSELTRFRGGASTPLWVKGLTCTT